jgi:hypothetical protein
MNKKSILFVIGAALTLSMGACTEDANMHNIGNDVVARDRIKENQRYQESGTIKNTPEDKPEAKEHTDQKEKNAE